MRGHLIQPEGRFPGERPLERVLGDEQEERVERIWGDCSQKRAKRSNNNLTSVVLGGTHLASQEQGRPDKPPWVPASASTSGCTKRTSHAGGPLVCLHPRPGPLHRNGKGGGETRAPLPRLGWHQGKPDLGTQGQDKTEAR